MTREEAIHHLYTYSSTNGSGQTTDEQHNEAKRMAIKALEQEPRWIPVSERLPNTEDEVLCWYEYYHLSQKKILPEYGLGCYFKETKSWFGEVANGKDVRVIAWMPLPEPYKHISEEEQTK